MLDSKRCLCADRTGQAVRIDPHTYYGHGEADLRCLSFSRIRPAFYRAYFAVNPCETDCASRVEIYKLYHLLNHLILFGEGSCPSARKSFVVMSKPKDGKIPCE